MNEHNAGVLILSTHTEAENAVRELQRANFNLTKLSIVGKDYHTEENVVGYYSAGDRMSYWGTQGAFWGGIWGLLYGSAFFWVPGVGPLIVAGPLVTYMLGALQGAVVVGGLSALGAALYSIGIPKDSILKYETAIKSDQYALVVHGTSGDLAHAKDILNRLGYMVEDHTPAVEVAQK